MTIPADAAHRSARGGLATTSLALAIVAIAGSIIASAVLGGTIGPQQAASGGHFLTMPEPYTALAAVLVLSQVLWTLVGAAALIVAIVSLSRGPGRSRATVALIISAVAPVLSFILFVGMVFATSPLA